LETGQSIESSLPICSACDETVAKNEKFFDDECLKAGLQAGFPVMAIAIVLFWLIFSKDKREEFFIYMVLPGGLLGFLSGVVAHQFRRGWLEASMPHAGSWGSYDFKKHRFNFNNPSFQKAFEALNPEMFAGPEQGK